ncbi:MAG: HAD family hydrolase [Myxococcaceae bacterium]|nr:HAD family hydrolase [Myxococcaceae bacterium]
MAVARGQAPEARRAARRLDQPAGARADHHRREVARLPAPRRRVRLGQAHARGQQRRRAPPGGGDRAGVLDDAPGSADARRPGDPLVGGGRLRRRRRGAALGQPPQPQALRRAGAARAHLVEARAARDRRLRRQRLHPGCGGEAGARRRLPRARARLGDAHSGATRVKPTVLLFDIDGTLITTGGAGRLAIVRAFATVYGRPDACDHFSFSGMTDRAIVRLGLDQIGVTAADSTIDELLARYVELLEEEVWKMDDARYRIHAGMLEAIDAGHANRCAVGLGTGNVKSGAMAKLRRVGLHQRFDFGGFGDDHELRPELIRRGAERGAQRLGVSLAEARVVVIGDTPKDVAAAQAIGAESIAVATGGHRADELWATGATHVFEDLSRPGAIEALLGGA